MIVKFVKTTTNLTQRLYCIAGERNVSARYPNAPGSLPTCLVSEGKYKPIRSKVMSVLAGEGNKNLLSLGSRVIIALT